MVGLCREFLVARKDVDWLVRALSDRGGAGMPGAVEEALVTPEGHRGGGGDALDHAEEVDNIGPDRDLTAIKGRRRQ